MCVSVCLCSVFFFFPFCKCIKNVIVYLVTCLHWGGSGDGTYSTTFSTFPMAIVLSVEEQERGQG